MLERLTQRLTQLLPSSRPKCAMIPTGPATQFAELLLFTVSALEHVGIRYIAHYGTLLGAARLGAPLPWDEDHDLYLFGITPESVREKLHDLFRQHGYRLLPDPNGFFWVRERIWPAASGHLALEFLPALLQHPDDLPIWDGGAPHLLFDELLPLRQLPFCSSFVWGPAATEAILQRLYGRSGERDVMQAFVATPISAEARTFWARARTPQAVDWPAISERFRSRSRWKYLLNVPWWWFNGGYIVIINRIKAWARRRHLSPSTKT